MQSAFRFVGWRLAGAGAAALGRRLRLGWLEPVDGDNEAEPEADEVQARPQRERGAIGIGDRVTVKEPDRRDRVAVYLGE